MPDLFQAMLRLKQACNIFNECCAAYAAIVDRGAGGDVAALVASVRRADKVMHPPWFILVHLGAPCRTLVHLGSSLSHLVQAVKNKANAVALLYCDDGDFPTWCATMTLPHAWFDFVVPPVDAMMQADEAAASLAYLVVSANAAAA